jgi:hypothetical protein
MVRFGFRVPSLKKRISARTSVKRYVRNSLGLKAPRGWGWLTNPKKAAYNRVYNRTTRGCLVVLGFWVTVAAGAAVSVPILVRASSPSLLRGTGVWCQTRHFCSLPNGPECELAHGKR